MKSIDLNIIDDLPGLRLDDQSRFNFRCHSAIGCFNRCCRNLNLFLYPYDLVRLKRSLAVSSDQLLDRHVDVVLRPGNHFPDVLLRMADNAERTCPFLTEAGCRVYPDRPGTCRTFPVEQGQIFDDAGHPGQTLHFFRPPDFCLGPQEARQWTRTTWYRDQEAEIFNRMTVQWAKLKALFHEDPWQGAGPDSPQGKMAFMATHNMDQFRQFVFESTFLKRYRISATTLKRIRRDDTELLKLGIQWVKLYLFRIPAKSIRPRR